MSKTLTYSTFFVAALAMILLFVTSKSYTQLGVSVVLYPLLAYFALKLFPHKSRKGAVLTLQMPAKSTTKVSEAERQKVEVMDIDKRTFLKLVGTAGLSFFFFSLLGRRVEALLFGRALESRLTGVGDTPEGGSSAPTAVPDEFKIAEIDENVVTYYGFTAKSGSWLIMREDTENNSFRYAKGNSGFPGNWSRREKLKYDYFSNLSNL